MTLSKRRIQRRVTLADQVYEILCESIVAGELRSGEHLNFEQLAPRLGVSQTPIREAAIRLVQDGLAIDRSDGKLQVVSLTEEYVTNVFLVRGALEGLAGELAAPLISSEKLGELRILLERGTKALAEGDVQGYGKAGGPFHQQIIDAANNHALSHELRGLRTHVRYVISYSQRNAGHHLLRSQEEHWEMLEALASRDAAATRQAVERHIRNCSERIAELIEFDSLADSRL